MDRRTRTRFVRSLITLLVGLAIAFIVPIIVVGTFMATEGGSLPSASLDDSTGIQEFTATVDRIQTAGYIVFGVQLAGFFIAAVGGISALLILGAWFIGAPDRPTL